VPLLRWPNGSSRPNPWGIDFLMMTHDGSSIRCTVMRAALEKLLDDPTPLPQGRQLTVFDTCRAKVESVASQKYDCRLLEDDVIIVRPEDVVKAGLAG
jgi:hypothetical protein